jgi:hypothetical protein
VLALRRRAAGVHPWSSSPWSAVARGDLAGAFRDGVVVVVAFVAAALVLALADAVTPD